MQDSERNRVAASRSELVDVEGQRFAGLRRGSKVLEQRAIVKGEVRRADHRNRFGADVGSMCGQLDGLSGRLGAAVNRNREFVRPRGNEEFRSATALRGAEQDPLAGRAEREQSVEAARLE